MENITELLKRDESLLVLAVLLIILLLAVIIMIIRFSLLNKRYKNFMKKIGNGKNIEEDLETYMYRVNKVEQQNGELGNVFKKLE